MFDLVSFDNCAGAGGPNHERAEVVGAEVDRFAAAPTDRLRTALTITTSSSALVHDMVLTSAR
jgi:hypothetical protein